MNYLKSAEASNRIILLAVVTALILAGCLSESDLNVKFEFEVAQNIQSFIKQYEKVLFKEFEGLLFKYRWSPTVIDHVICIMLCLWVIFIFTFKFIGTRQTQPRFYKCTIFFLLVIFTGNTLFQFYFFSSSIANLYLYENVLSFWWILLIFINITLVEKKESRVMKYYLTPLLFFVLFKELSLLDGYFRIFAETPIGYIKIGTLIELIAFAYFMTRLVKNIIDRVNNLEYEELKKNYRVLAETHRTD